MHNVSLTSQHRHYVSEPDHALLTEPIVVNEGLVFEEHPVQILDRKIKQLCIKWIPLIKVHWANHTSSEASWGNQG